MRLLALAICAGIAAGCGSAASQDASRRSTADAASTNDASSSRPPEAASPTHPQAAAPPDRVISANTTSILAPTAEQIARWTPAPFEPLQLLGIREWEKTSFTARLAATPDGKHFITVGSRVLLWSMGGEQQPEHVFLDLAGDDQDRRLLSLAVSPDGKWFAVGDSEGTVRIWSLVDRKELAAKQLRSTGIQWLAISPDAKVFAAISYDSEVATYSVPALEQQKKFEVNTRGVERIEYAAPKRLAAAGETTSLWDTSTGAVVQQLSPGRYNFALARSPDGSRFLFGGDDSLHLWNASDLKPQAEIAHGVSGSEFVAFSPDGKFLATTNGRSVTLWNLAERRAVQVMDSFGWPIAGVCWLPQTNLLAVASDIGCTRIWGTPSAGAAVDLKPLHGPLAMPDAASKKPASPSQLESLIDLRTFPRLPGSEPSVVGQPDFHAVVPTTPDEAKIFYAYFLEKEGWTAITEPSANPATTTFDKSGFRISLSTYDAGDGKTNVMLRLAGNYDVRWAPKFDGAPIETVYEHESSVSYRTKAELVQIETTLLRKLHAAGWTGYSRLKSSHSEQPDSRDFECIQNGATLRVSIGKFPADPASYTIQYSLQDNSSWAPVPPDAGFVEFDGSTEPALVAVTKLTLDEARQFYDHELTSHGWLTRELGRAMKENYGWLSYVRNQSDLTIGLTKLPDGRTLVRVGDVGGSLWELSQKDEKPAAADAVGLEAADFPVLNASKTAKFDPINKSIEVQIEGATLAAAAEQYAKTLEPLGWTPEKGGIRSEDYTFLTFKKDDKEIDLRARPKDGAAVINFQGDGLLWTKELPGGKQIASYETWLRQNKRPPGLEGLDEYESEMRAISGP
jgi:WD40 repeat protein